MAISTYKVTEVTSDLSNESGAETLRYSVGDNRYEIDLTKVEVKEFHEALAPYISVSRVKGGKKAPARPKADPEETAKIRAWAIENGHEVSATGRIPNAVRQAYNDSLPTAKRVRRAKPSK